MVFDKMIFVNNLSTIYEKAKNEQFDEAIQLLEDEIKIKRLVNYYINVAEQIDDQDKNIIELIIRVLQEIYNNATVPSPIPDEEYDHLYEIHRDNSGTEIVGASVGARDKLIGFHRYTDLRGTLDKIHFFSNEEKKKDKRKSLDNWITTIENRLGRSLLPDEKEYEAFPKWDGISAIFECDADGTVERVLSRGDTDKNEAIDYSAMFKGTNMGSLCNTGNPFGVKTEIVMSYDNYDELCKNFGDFNNPRSAVSSIFNSSDLDRKYLPYLTIVPLQVQDFETKEITIARDAYDYYPNLAGTDITDPGNVKVAAGLIEKIVTSELGIDIDGIVYRLKNPRIQKLLGREGKINKYEVAYKLPAPTAKTTIKDVIFSVGILGSITPVAQIDPVVLKGNKIDSPSLGSIDRFEELGLSEGDEVIIRYDVVPYLYIDETCRKGTGRKFETPVKCPYCYDDLVKKPTLKCINENCSSRMIGKIMNYVEKMRISNISIGTITTLFKYKFLQTIGSLYLLENFKNDIKNIPGFGEKSITKIINGINSRKDVYEYELLGSLGIPDIGQKIFKKILNIYYFDELLQICISGKRNKLTEIGGIKSKTADKIIEGIVLNRELIDFLCSHLNVKRDERSYTIKVLFTKVRDKDFEAYLDTKGVQVMENYNKDVDLVIVPSMSVSSDKVEKAQKDGKAIVTIDDAYRMFEYNK